MLESRIVFHISRRVCDTENMEDSTDKLSIIVFGATGDLATKKVWRAVANLRKKELLPKLNVIGVAHRERSQDEFKKIVTDASSSDSWWESIKYINGDLNNSAVYKAIL